MSNCSVLFEDTIQQFTRKRTKFYNHDISNGSRLGKRKPSTRAV